MAPVDRILFIMVSFIALLVQTLQDEILAQQTVISQTSQALNLCQASSEFYGSSEQTEGERLLLIASELHI